jgi:hypothetical protein
VNYMNHVIGIGFPVFHPRNLLNRGNLRNLSTRIQAHKIRTVCGEAAETTSTFGT